MQRELDQLAPVFEASKTDVQLRQEAVEACQKEYAAAKETCKKQEQDIEFMQGPIEILKREAQAEFEKVSNLLFYSWRLEFFNTWVACFRPWQNEPRIRNDCLSIAEDETLVFFGFLVSVKPKETHLPLLRLHAGDGARENAYALVLKTVYRTVVVG